MLQSRHREYLALMPTTPSSCQGTHYQPITSPSSAQSLLGVKILSVLSAIVIHITIPALAKLWQKDCHNSQASVNYIAKVMLFLFPVWGKAAGSERKEKIKKKKASLLI